MWQGVVFGFYCFCVFFGFLLGLAALLAAVWLVGKMCGFVITITNDDDDDDGCAT